MSVVSYSDFTSNHNNTEAMGTSQFVVSYSDFTSNHNLVHTRPANSEVVSYSDFTSNHNQLSTTLYSTYVVSYSDFTSNHNVISDLVTASGLFLIPTLHQTTTKVAKPIEFSMHAEDYALKKIKFLGLRSNLRSHFFNSISGYEIFNKNSICQGTNYKNTKSIRTFPVV